MNQLKIQVVEDEWVVADQICRNLKKFGYVVPPSIPSAEEALRKIEEERPDLVLMDIVLKGKMDGIEAAEQITSRFDIPVIYLTAYTGDDYLERAMQTQPFSYLVKPFKEKEIHCNIKMALHKHEVEKILKEHLEQLGRNLKGAINAIAETIELRGYCTPGHHQRVAKWATAMAGELGLTDFQVQTIKTASAVYDVGLISMPAEILRDIGHPTGIQLILYHKYPTIGYSLFHQIGLPWPIADIILQHRERFDGTGFPKGIKGEEILKEAMILAVADAIEDLTSNKSYRAAMTLNQALEEISIQKGFKYDPAVVDACLRCQY